jgi:hypothetical protein
MDALRRVPTVRRANVLVMVAKCDWPGQMTRRAAAPAG